MAVGVFTDDNVCVDAMFFISVMWIDAGATRKHAATSRTEIHKLPFLRAFIFLRFIMCSVTQRTVIVLMLVATAMICSNTGIKGFEGLRGGSSLIS